MLDKEIVESVKSGDDADTILSKFSRVYNGTHYPPIAVYRTLLFCSAIQFNNDALVVRLLEAGYDVNYNFGYVTPSPLNVAIQIGREDYVKQLLEVGASVNLENSTSVTNMIDAYTALELAIKLDSWNLVQLLTPLYDYQKTRTHRTALHLACLYGSRQCIELILNTSEGQAHVNLHDCCDAHFPEGYTPLMLGVHHGAWLVGELLKNGADAKYVTNRTHRSVLHLACCPQTKRAGEVHRFVSKDLPQVIQLLVEAGCNPNQNEKCGDTPLSLLITQISQELNAQRDVNYPYEIDVHRQAVLNSVSTLLQMGSNPNGHIRKSSILIVIHQLHSVLRPLCHIIYDVNVRDIFVQSALSASCLARDLLWMLILNGANTKASDVVGSNNIVDYFLQIIIQVSSSWTDDHKQFTSGILAHFADIFRILLLSSYGSFQSNLVFYLFFKEISGSEFFITVLFNYSGRRNFKAIMNQVVKEVQYSSSPSLEKLYMLIGKEPATLKHIVRVKILQCFGNKALIRIPTLNLPSVLKEYIISLK